MIQRRGSLDQRRPGRVDTPPAASHALHPSRGTGAVAFLRVNWPHTQGETASERWMMRTRSSGRVALIASAFALAGCLKQTAVLPRFVVRDRPGAVRVVDARPEREKTTEHLSLWMGSCDYAVRRLGDEVTEPPRLVLLQQDLTERLGPRAHGQVVTVTRYVIHHNRRAQMKVAVLGGQGRLVVGGVRAVRDSCPKEATTAGGFDAAETTTLFSPLIVEIEASTEGRTYAVRVVHSPREEFTAFGEPDAAMALFAAMRKATNALVRKLGEP